VVGFICVFSHGAMMKKNNNSLIKDEISMFWSLLACLLYKQSILVTTITIKEGLGSFFLVAISTIGGGIYFHFLS
jgi:hypothetical protein